MAGNTSQDFSVQNLDYDGHILRAFGPYRRYTDLQLNSISSNPEGIYILLGDFTQDVNIAGHIVASHSLSSGDVAARGSLTISVQSTIEPDQPYRSINATVEYNRTAPSDIKLVQVDYNSNTYGAIKIAGNTAKWYPRHFFFSGLIAGDATFTPIIAESDEVSNETAWNNTNTDTQTVYLSKKNVFKGTIEAGTIKGDTESPVRSGDPYVLQLDDRSTLIRKSDDGNIEVPDNATVPFPVETTIAIMAGNSTSTNAISIVPGTGVTIHSFDDLNTLPGANASCALIKVNTNLWKLSGNLV